MSTAPPRPLPDNVLPCIARITRRFLRYPPLITGPNPYGAIKSRLLLPGLLSFPQFATPPGCRDQSRACRLCYIARASRREGGNRRRSCERDRSHSAVGRVHPPLRRRINPAAFGVALHGAAVCVLLNRGVGCTGRL